MSARGHLRVLLGAAPGVGKTCAMLAEGSRLLQEGSDVVIAVVETHGRATTARMTRGIPAVPLRRVPHRGVELAEMDLEAVLSRAPQVALVDELAHTVARPEGALHEKRWQQVDVLLAAGIDVITTLNIQHIESLHDVVQRITGILQRERVPDTVVRAADQIEVVDLAPQALQGRLRDGLVYPAERIDAALAHFFRLGNLTALRELALLWVADEVDQALTRYRDENGIESTWEARERVVVALTGGSEGETLLRRGARIAARSAGGELLVVHVSAQDGLRTSDPGALARQRTLTDDLGGTFTQVVGDDVPSALVEFARSVNATQLVLGASRRSRWAAALTGPGIGASVVRDAGDIDVHMVPHAAAARSPLLPPLGGALTARRRLLGAAVALLGGPALTAGLSASASPDSLTSDVLAYQLLVVVVALTGGLWPALFAAVLSGLSLDYFFIAPLRTISISDPLHLLALALYVVIAVLVSVVVDHAARRARAARRAAAESELIQSVAGSVLRGDDAVQALTSRARESLRLDSVELKRVDGTVLATAGAGTAATDGSAAHRTARIAVGADAELVLAGRDLAGSERRLLQVIALELATALEHGRLRETAREIAPLAASDRTRGAILSALGHDLRRPLAAATAAVGGLRAAGSSLSPSGAAALLETADESLGALSALVEDLLDVNRLQAGALSLARRPVDPAEAIAPALEELALGPGDVALALGHEEAAVLADPVPLRRVVVNLLSNARRHSPESTRVRIATSTFAGTCEIRVIDRGPGVAPERMDEIFQPFQRLGDTDNTTGLGLGLALSRGLVEAMGGTLTPEDTPGGGLTMVVSLPLADHPPAFGGSA